MNAALWESLYAVYEQGRLEPYLAGARGLKRDLIIGPKKSALIPERDNIFHFYAVNRWAEDEEFQERATPSEPLSAEAERVLGITQRGSRIADRPLPLRGRFSILYIGDRARLTGLKCEIR